MGNKGYGFVTFETPEGAVKAVKMSGRNIGCVHQIFMLAFVFACDILFQQRAHDTLILSECWSFSLQRKHLVCINGAAERQGA